MLNKLPFGHLFQGCVNDVRYIMAKTVKVPGETDGAQASFARYAGFDGI